LPLPEPPSRPTICPACTCRRDHDAPHGRESSYTPSSSMTDGALITAAPRYAG
jgi:hypothetical protein